jgi:hypothetical protein
MTDDLLQATLPETFYQAAEPVFRAGHVRLLFIGLVGESAGEEKRNQSADDG